MKRKNKIRPEQVNMLYRQLAAMTGAGMTVGGAIQALAEDSEDSPINPLVEQMNKDIMSGKKPGEVLAANLPQLGGLPARFFDQESKVVSSFFSDIAEFSEKRQLLKGFINLSFLYPGLVVLVLLLVIGLLMVVVVPMLASMFVDMGQALPLPTRIVIALSSFMGGWAFACIVIAAIAGVLVLRRNKNWLYAIIDKVPGFRALNRKIACAELARTLALLTKLHVPVQEILQAAASSVTNQYYSLKIAGIACQCQGLSQFVLQLRQAGIVPALISHTVHAGDRSGTLAEALHESARFMETDAEKAYDRFVVLLYPVTIIILGLIVGFCVVAMYMPIFQMGSAVG